MSVIAFLLMTLPVMSQPNDTELADPKPGPQEAWNALKKITLGWGTIDQRYSRSQVPVTSTKTLILRAWKGERVAAQAVLATPIELQNVSMTVSDLKCGKSVIPASNVKKYFVRYVMSLDPEMKLNHYGKGKYLLRHAFEKDGIHIIGAPAVACLH